MGAVWMRMRAEGRARWRAWLALALVFGAGAGASIAAAAGGRRAETAYPRLLAWADAPDAFTGGIREGDKDRPETYEAVTRLPQLRKAVLGRSPCCTVRDARGREITFPDVVASIVPPAAPEAFVVKLLRGRDLDPRDPGEATLSFGAERAGLALGDTVEVVFTPERSEPTPVPVRVVGIHAAPAEFPAIGGVSFPGLRLSPAFQTAHADLLATLNASDSTGVAMWFRPGVTVEDVRAELARRGIPVEVPFVLAENAVAVQRSMRLESLALWTLGGLLALATLAILGQSLARETALASNENPALRALGMSRGELFTVGIVRALGIGAAAAGAAAGVAVLLSPLTPIGLARIADPDTAFRIDTLALLVGAFATATALVAVAVVPARRAARASTDAPETGVTGRGRPSLLASKLAAAAAAPSAVTGVRFAFEPGHGRTAVPTRSAITGTAVGIGALVMAAVFSASLGDVIRSPRLHGFAWDALVDGAPEDERAIREDPRFAVAAGGALPLRVENETLLSVLIEHGRGLEPVIAAGRAPRGPAEIALGGATMRQIGAGIGSTVRVATYDPGGGEHPGRSITATVVGRVITPPLFFEAHEPGEGAAVDDGMMIALHGGTPDFDPITQPAQLLVFGDGLDRDATIAELRRRFFVLPRVEPASLAAIEDLRALPLALAAILGLLAVATLAHTLLTSARRRARDLAILKTIGFVRRQLRAAVAWQSSALVIVALVLGIPAGLIAGRWGWVGFANHLAVLPRPSVAALWVAAGVPSGLALANVIALVPARFAARTPAAVVLRTE